VPRGDVRRIRSTVCPVATRRGRDEIGVGTYESSDEPLVRTAERAKSLGKVRDDVLLGARLPCERDRELCDRLRIDALPDLQPIPCAALQVLCRDRIRVEIARAHEVQGSAHETRADDRALLLDRGPQILAFEVLQTRPQRYVR